MCIVKRMLVSNVTHPQLEDDDGVIRNLLLRRPLLGASKSIQFTMGLTGAQTDFFVLMRCFLEVLTYLLFTSSRI